MTRKQRCAKIIKDSVCVESIFMIFYVFLYGHHLVALLATMWPTGGTSSSA
jgi:hypothetical protein